MLPVLSIAAVAVVLGDTSENLQVGIALTRGTGARSKRGRRPAIH